MNKKIEMENMTFETKRKCEDIADENRLVEAAKSGNYDDALLLLDSGTDPDTPEYNKQLFYQSENYMTPLHYATTHGFAELVKLFIQRGANVNACDRFDVTPLHTAAELGHEDCLALLLEGEADCNISTKFSKHGSYTAVPHPGGTTPLHLAAKHNHVNCVKRLIWDGADYNAVDERCRTSLYMAAESGYSNCVHAHLDNAIWKDILSLPDKLTGNTPLHQCVRQNMQDCSEKLLDRGSDVNHLNQSGFSPLHYSILACQKFNINIVRALITKGYNADVNLSEKSHSYTPLHYACFNDSSTHERRPELAVLLLAYGANYNIRNRNGDPVLVSELRGRHSDTTILSAIARCTAHLPSLESLGLGSLLSNPRMLPPARPPPLDHVPHDHHQDLQQQIVTARTWSECQQSKLTWYKDMLKGPRALQHYCRCVIRDRMGPKRLIKIHKLPLPNTLKDYLLLHYD